MRSADPGGQAAARGPVLVVGAGTMGTGIAQVAALAGHPVQIFDTLPEAAAKACEKIANFLQRDVDKGRVTAADRAAALARVNAVTTLEPASSSSVIIEAIREMLEEKQSLFRRLDLLAPPSALLLTNTSMLLISSIAAGLRNPERVAGCHFFNPVPRMQLVEVVGGEKTSRATLEAVAALVTSWGKTPIPAPDTPGFIVNRGLLMLLNEAAMLVAEGVAAAHVDEAMKLGCGFPMGPLELMDMVGIDVVLDCQIALWEQFGRHPKYEPAPLLRRLVADGRLGRKSGRGFHGYE